MTAFDGIYRSTCAKVALYVRSASIAMISAKTTQRRAGSLRLYVAFQMLDGLLVRKNSFGYHVSNRNNAAKIIGLENGQVPDVAFAHDVHTGFYRIIGQYPRKAGTHNFTHLGFQRRFAVQDNLARIVALREQTGIFAILGYHYRPDIFIGHQF